MKSVQVWIFFILLTALSTINISAATLTVSTAGVGSGVVTSSPDGINCIGSNANRALGKPVTALTDTVMGLPEKIVDGLCESSQDCPPDSFWYSFQTCGTSYNSFIIDLLSSTPITELHFSPLQIYFYTIWTSDNNTDWTQRHSDSSGPFSADITIPVNGAYSARYFKYEGANTTCGYAGMGEFEVYVPNVCSYDFIDGTLVTLTAAADAGSIFVGWSNGTGSASGCTGTGSCSFPSNDASSITATFTRPVASPEEGTVGTVLTIAGSGFGTKTGKVLIGGAPIKIAKGAWTPDTITGMINKPLPPGIPYDVILQLKEPKGAALITLPGAFTMMAPEITSVEPKSGSAPAEILISGNYFGTKKGKVYLEYEQSGKLKKKNCKVKTWGMDSIIFFVPKTSKSFPAKEYTLKVTNKVGEDSETFTVE